VAPFTTQKNLVEKCLFRVSFVTSEWKMEDTFKIFVRRLKDGHQEKIDEHLSPDFLDVNEAELAFKTPVKLDGSAAAVDEMLVLRLSIHTEATMPCSICNKETQVKIFIPSFYYTKPLSEIKGSVFDYREAIREEILLELPLSTECNGGDCPERATLAQYFTKGA
jgi:uncharacterized metal-binding protein YceD (DUF177 family)